MLGPDFKVVLNFIEMLLLIQMMLTDDDDIIPYRSTYIAASHGNRTVAKSMLLSVEEDVVHALVGNEVRHSLQS